MALPTIALAAHWSSTLPPQWSVIQGPISSLEAPAVVLRADDPWIIPGPSFCHDMQQYAAIAVVSASSPSDGEADLLWVFIQMMDNLTDGWKFVSAGMPRVDQSTGTALLAAKMVLTYANSEQESS